VSGIRAELGERWRTVIDDLGGAGAGTDLLGQELIDRYQEPTRHYHTDRHLLAVLVALDELCGPEAAGPDLRLAAWFHDAIYSGRAGADEEASAQLAEHRLGALGLDPQVVARVADMVRATARHLDAAAQHDERTALLLDADLSILGADAVTYDAYCEGVRQEHASVPDDRFVAGRLAVVEALLDRPRLFLTGPGEDRYLKRARENLRRERAQLIARRGGGAPPG
jgi:predicted metal-dependent HD superfamily phosphohydrolase